MKAHPVESSVIAAIAYSRVTRTLLVQFQSGRLYRYTGVPRYRRDRLMRAESVGRYFNAHIRSVYPHAEVK